MLHLLPILASTLCSKALSWPGSVSVTGSPKQASLTARACFSSSVPSSRRVPVYFIPPAFQESCLQPMPPAIKNGAKMPSELSFQTEISLDPPRSQASSTHVPLPAQKYTHHCLGDLIHGAGAGTQMSLTRPSLAALIQSQSPPAHLT